MSSRRLFITFMALIWVAGSLCVVLALVTSPLPPLSGAAVVVGLLVVVTELKPVQVLHRSESTEVAASTAFSLALLLLAGLPAALLAQLAGSATADAVRGKSAIKTLFNLAQYAISLTLANHILLLTGDRRPLHNGLLPATQVPEVIGAALAFYLMNNCLVWTAVSLATDSSFIRRMREEWLFQTSTALLLLGLGPVVDLVARVSLAMLPFLLLPVAAVYLTARSWTDQAYQALHDGLTGLGNRTLFAADVTAALEHCVPNKAVAVLLIDLDRFKEINDTLGHHIGDKLLREIGPRAVLASDRIASIARFGGDEFAVLVTDATNGEDALAVAKHLATAFSDVFVVDAETALEVEASIGVAIAPQHGTNVDLLLQHADVAMYLAKEARTGAELYCPDRDQNSRRRLRLITDLRTAIDNGELILYYQPKLHLATGRYLGVEALARWHHPQFGIIPPSDFIPLAEHTGLIGPLTRRVLDQAIIDTRRWHDLGLPIRVAVNVSARNLHSSGLPQTIDHLLSEAVLSADFVELEITETELMLDPDHAARVLRRLHEMGVRLTIDDFGTGYSSLAYIRSLPIDEIKIDRSFISTMEGRGETSDEIIVRSTIDLARNLGLEVTAEGVETEAQLRRLTTLRCDFAQGFYLKRPAAFDDVTLFLQESCLTLNCSAA